MATVKGPVAEGIPRTGRGREVKGHHTAVGDFLKASALGERRQHGDHRGPVEQAATHPDVRQHAAPARRCTRRLGLRP